MVSKPQSTPSSPVKDDERSPVPQFSASQSSEHRLQETQGTQELQNPQGQQSQNKAVSVPHQSVVSTRHKSDNTFFKKAIKGHHYSSVILSQMVKTDFQLRYQGSFLGIAWSVLKPLLLFVVMYLVFVKFLRFTNGTPNYALSLLLGISLWNFFAEATGIGLSSIVARGDILRKVHFPPAIITVSATIGALISLGINLAVVLIFCFIRRVDFTWNVLWLPLNLLEYYLFTLGVTLIIATIDVYFRDMQHIWEVFMQVFFYGTPIIYPLEMITERAHNPIFAKLLLLNPVAQIIQDFRHNLIDPQATPTVWTEYHHWYYQMIPILLVFVILGIGIFVFNKHSHKFAEVL